MAPKTTAVSKRPWQEIAQEAQDYRDASIANLDSDVSRLSEMLPRNVFGILRQHLSQTETELTEKPPEELLKLLAYGTVTATAVSMAFLRRASLAQKLVCVK